MVVLAGPFCLRSGLDYSPLKQAMERAALARPEFLVLLGPLLEATNEHVASGCPRLPGEEEPCTFEEAYTLHVLPTLLRCVAALRRESPGTQVLVVPSLEEVLCFHPLPQPPLDAMLAPLLPGEALERLRSLGVLFLPNPSHLRVGDLRISLTSADALSPVLRSGLVLRPEGGRRLEEGLRGLLGQRRLFPVLPRDPPQVSEARAESLDFPDGEVPHLCIFPSHAGVPSHSVVDGCAFLNPGSVCLPAALGCFAEVRLSRPAADAGPDAGPTSSCSCAWQVDIHRVAG